MEGYEALPEPIKKIQQSLHPYIQQRLEVARVRRVLASHLNSSLNPDGEHHLPPLSLVDASYPVDLKLPGLRGIQKEYMRCIRANIKARREYAQISKDHNVKTAGRDQVHGLSDEATATFLDFVKQEQKHRILRIIQDYVDMLAKKPAAAVQHLDPKLALKNLEPLPQIPAEVLNTPGASQRSGDAGVKELVDQLEKSVLRAKMLLKREQKLLAEVRSRQSVSKASQAGRLQALGTARNELIHWIETELSQGEPSPEADEQSRAPGSGNTEGEYIEDHLALIRRQYARYTKARQALLIATTGRLHTPTRPTLNEHKELPIGTSEATSNWNAMGHITYPYMEKLLSVSNNQKTMIQQKSHLTIVLAKQMKEANQGLDRLADESHLLRAYPSPIKASRRTGLELSGSFAEGTSHFEKLDSSRRVQPWVYASDSAATATKSAILEKLDEGSTAIDSTHQIFLDLRRLLGDDSGASQSTAENKDLKSRLGSKDIWTEIDGTLGAIK